MNDAGQLQNDLAYVRHTVSGAETSRSPSSIPILWAAIVAVGFPLTDLAPSRVPLFWMIAGPAGFLASCALGWWDARRRGQLNRVEGAKWIAHFAALLAAIFLAVFLLRSGQITQKGFGGLVLLLLALVYFLAGIHLEGRLRWIGLLLAAGYVAVQFLSTYVWTIVGGVFALSLVATALIGGSKRADAL